jgi:phage terminase large subunit-like protein
MYTDNDLLNSFKEVYQSMGRQRHQHASSIPNTTSVPAKLITASTNYDVLGASPDRKRSEHSEESIRNQIEKFDMAKMMSPEAKANYLKSRTVGRRTQSEVEPMSKQENQVPV